MRLAPMLLLAITMWTLPASAVAGDSPAPSQPATAKSKAEAWVLGFITKHAPPGRKIWYPKGQETPEEGLKRYKSIAKDLVEYIYHPDTKRLFRGTHHGRSRSVVVLLGTMLHESGFMKHVDLNLGKHGRGDAGRSWCMLQLRIGTKKTLRWNTAFDRRVFWGDNTEDIFLGYTGDELIANRTLCIQEGYKLMRISFKDCEDLPILERLTGYASGMCTPKKDDEESLQRFQDGQKKSRMRMGSAMRYFNRTGPARGFLDYEVVEEIRTTLALGKDITEVAAKEPATGPEKVAVRN